MRYLAIHWPWQLGEAITLPRALLRAQVCELDHPQVDSDVSAVVAYRSTTQWRENVRLRRHEEEHVRQVHRLGWLTYIGLHIWARIVTRNIWGRGHWIEDDAYEAEEG